MLYGITSQAIDPRLNREVFDRALHFLHKVAAALPDGRHELGDGIHVIIKHYQPQEAAVRRYESHIAYADIQYVFEGGEIIYVTPSTGLPVSEDRLAADDARFHIDPLAGSPVREFHLLPGSYLYLPPEDAHKAECLCGFAEGRKAIVKIPMTLLLPS